ncbi:MAG: KamA family radical SAM protein [Calditrichaeota bacterium]|nr:KamA family radical SAM protein [Calditrichota bacterium]
MKNKVNWKNALIDSIQTEMELKPFTDQLKTSQTRSNFPLKIPRQFAEKIDPGNPDDPILLQISKPLTVEKEGFSDDPVGDHLAYKEAGILHKYKNRLLLILTGHCAIHCQYCFRQNYSYQDSKIDFKFLDAIKSYIEKNPQINEIILSGGDPLSLSNQQLDKLFRFIDQLSQIKITRIHSRFPVVIPDRLDDEFLNIIDAHKKQIVFVFHINHANEIDAHFRDQISKLKKRNVHLLNQSVLLSKINDSAVILIDLSYKLFEYGIIPYYLHQLDRVTGAEAFEVEIERGLQIIDEMKRELPGYLVPRYVKEIAGEPYKTILV